MNSSSKTKLVKFLKNKANSLGFDFCGISKAEKLNEEEKHLDTWLSNGYHGKMTYMENHYELRLDPTKLVPGAKSVVSLLYNYFPGNEQVSSNFKISKYAYGKDYHYVIKDKLKVLFEALRDKAGSIDGRVFVDSAPVMERQWAAKSGLGWLGKNTLLINKEMGSYFFLAEMIIDLELEYDGPIKDYCGTCTRCLDSCPTEAFVDGGVLDASRCISYLTIELKDAIPEEFSGMYKDWIFGCDICQEVCPWNRFSQKHTEPAFTMSDGAKLIMDGRWSEITDEVFNNTFKDSPLKRTKYRGLKRNIEFINEKSREERD